MSRQLLPPEIAAFERYIDQELLNASKLELTEDFDEWTLDMLKECEKEVLHCLRDTLAGRGVFIPRGKDRRKLYFKLLDTLGEKELHTWTPEEIQAQIDHGGGFVLNYRPPLPRTSLPSISSDQEANVASDLGLQSRDTTMGLGKVQLPQNQLTRKIQTQELVRGTKASVNKELSPKMEKKNYKDNFNDLKLDELPENQTRYNPHLDSEPPDGFVIQLTNISKLYIVKDAKYSGEKYDILDSKLTIFRDNCRK
ncbi:hypothetical protein EPUL_002619, partial [Erysiphe pulchra]